MQQEVEEVEEVEGLFALHCTARTDERTDQVINDALLLFHFFIVSLFLLFQFG